MTISQNSILRGGDMTSLVPCCEIRRPPSLASYAATWQARRRYRADLNRLLRAGPHLIADIGLTLHQAVAEANKPFWKPWSL